VKKLPQSKPINKIFWERLGRLKAFKQTKLTTARQKSNKKKTLVLIKKAARAPARKITIDIGPGILLNYPKELQEQIDRLRPVKQKVLGFREHFALPDPKHMMEPILLSLGGEPTSDSYYSEPDCNDEPEPDCDDETETDVN
jgi:hypothetical protein